MTETVLPPLTLPELMRCAAGKLRANAEGATPGQRDVEIDGDDVYVSTFGDYRVARTGLSGDSSAIANAKHYASWPPEAAVALADWLDAAADRSDPAEMTDALTLVRVLLAGTPMLDDFEAAAII